jgi:AraC family transcriptional regulator
MSTDPPARPQPDAAYRLTPSTLASSCGVSPRSSGAGTGDSRFAVAHFVRTDAAEFQARWGPDESMHMLGVQIRPQWMSARTNGRQTWCGQVPAMSVGLNRAGDRGEAVVRGPLSRLMYFVPDGLLRHCAEQVGIGSRPGDLELVNPGYQHDPEIAGLARQTLVALLGESELAPLRLEALGVLLCARLLERWSTLSVAARRVGAPPAVRGIECAQEMLRSRFAERLTISELARSAGLSDFHFCRAFRVATGVSAHQFQLALRVEKAQGLLRRTPLTIAEIAAQVGYEDASHLSRLFRRATGVSPSRYRAASVR